MKTYFYNGVEVRSGFPFELNGLAYPWNWFDLATADDLVQHGFRVVDYGDQPQ